MSTSRSALEFLRRHGIVPTPRLVSPSFSPGNLKINAIPLLRDQLDPGLLYADGLGTPAPDRGPTDQWPPLQKV